MRASWPMPDERRCRFLPLQLTGGPRLTASDLGGVTGPRTSNAPSLRSFERGIDVGGVRGPQHADRVPGRRSFRAS